MQKHLIYQNNMKNKLENGEVIERFEKKFGFNLWKEVQGFARGENEPAEVKVGKGWINISNDVKQFIYYALNQQRELLQEEAVKIGARERARLQAEELDWSDETKGFEKGIVWYQEFLTKLEEEK